MYACQSAALPGYTWVSANDATDFLPGWDLRAARAPVAR